MLATQRAKWDAAGIDSYEYSMFWGVFLGIAGDYHVRVVDGQPTELRRVDGSAVLHVPGSEVPRSIDELFDLLEHELAADRIDAQFDDQLGYPTAVLVDRDEHASDDELEIRISEFRPT